MHARQLNDIVLCVCLHKCLWILRMNDINDLHPVTTKYIVMYYIHISPGNKLLNILCQFTCMNQLYYCTSLCTILYIEMLGLQGKAHLKWRVGDIHVHMIVIFSTLLIIRTFWHLGEVIMIIFWNLVDLESIYQWFMEPSLSARSLETPLILWSHAHILQTYNVIGLTNKTPDSAQPSLISQCYHTFSTFTYCLYNVTYVHPSW